MIIKNPPAALIKKKKKKKSWSVSAYLKTVPPNLNGSVAGSVIASNKEMSLLP